MSRGRCIKVVRFGRRCRGIVYEINMAGQAVCHRHSDGEVATRAVKSSAIQRKKVLLTMAAMVEAGRVSEWALVVDALNRVVTAAEDRTRHDAQVRQVAREAGAVLHRLGLRQ